MDIAQAIIDFTAGYLTRKKQQQGMDHVYTR